MKGMPPANEEYPRNHHYVHASTTGFARKEASSIYIIGEETPDKIGYDTRAHRLTESGSSHNLADGKRNRNTTRDGLTVIGGYNSPAISIAGP